MNSINPKNNNLFPASSDTWEYLQNMVKLVAKLARLGAENYILDGCVTAGNYVSAGTIVVGGEMLPFDAGLKQDYIIVLQTNRNVTVGATVYNNVYSDRKAMFGTGENQVLWSSFERITDIMSLETLLGEHAADEQLHVSAEKQAYWNEYSIPAGGIIMWSGLPNAIPEGWHLCDGTQGTPDLRGRFIVGYDERTESGYETVGDTGGEESVVLGLTNIPAHSHIVPCDMDESHDSGDLAIGGGTVLNKTIETAETGGSLGVTIAHENRPPYFVLAYIIKL